MTHTQDKPKQDKPKEERPGVRKHNELFETEDVFAPPGGASVRDTDDALEETDSETSGDPKTQKAVRGGGQSLEHYLREVSRWKLLTAEAERALARRIAKGDQAALEELITSNLRLVVYWAKRYGASGMPIQDLIQEGNLGLMRAAEKFDHRKGTRFSTYASWWIRQSLTRAICERQDLIRIPVHMHQKMRIVDRALESTGAGDSPDADIEATVGQMGVIPFAEWQRTHRLQQSVSLDRRMDRDHETSIEVEDDKAICPMRQVYLRETREQLRKFMKELPQRHQSVLKLRYGLGGEDEHTLESIGLRLRISRERVRQIQSEAIQRLAEKTGQRAPRPIASGIRRKSRSTGKGWLKKQTG